MDNLKDIQDTVNDAFNRFKISYLKFISQLSFPVNEIFSNVDLQNGKHLRPLLTLLSAGIFAKPSEKAVNVAVAVELLHNTTLVHDDVVDESSIRRNKQTINTLQGNKIAILAGDYLFSQVLKILTQTNDVEIIKRISLVTEQMGIGELLQQYTSRNNNTNIDNYYDIINKKTAQLMSCCCNIGAYCSNANTDYQQLMADFGIALGTAFQIEDDIIDYIGTNSGKEKNNDIREKKLTLPLLFVLNSDNKDLTTKIQEKLNSNTLQQSDVDFIKNTVVEQGGIDFAKQEKQKYINIANNILQQLPTNNYTQALCKLLKII